jgi:AcrR family transcriptional regulator
MRRAATLDRVSPPETEAAVVGLRERKKQRTRETITRVAIELFSERGFEATTIADIAEAADIAPRTFFGYFPSKEDVVFHDSDDVFDSFGERLRERPDDETTFDAMRAWFSDWASQIDLTDPADRARKRLIRSTPALAAHERVHRGRFEALLAEAVAQDLDVPVTSLRPHLVAAAASAAFDALESFHDDREAPPADRVTAVMDEALLFLRGGLDALRRHPPA